MRPEPKTIAGVSRAGVGQLKPEEVALTVGWGSGGSGKPVMPGTGRVELNSGSPYPRPLREGEGVVPGEIARCVPEPHRPLAKRAATRLGLHHRRLPGHEEVAQLP